MNNPPLISVIIPVYRLDSSYLNQCLNSLCTQTFSDFEALLVLNNSSDSEKSTCAKFRTADSRFKLFSIDIADISTARNIGLDHAQGKYITFLDSDDILLKNSLECLYNLMETANVDIGLANSKKFWNNSKEKSLFNLKKSVNKISLKTIPHFAVWGYVFKKEIINLFHIYFKEHLKLSEDKVFLYEYITHCNKIAYSNEVVYLYRQNNASVCHAKQSSKHALQQIDAANFIADTLKNNPSFTALEIAHIKRKLSRTGMTAYISSGQTSLGKNEIKQHFKKHISSSTVCFNYCWLRAKVSFIIGKLLHL